MIDLYYWTTPNGHKISIFLEEAELPYTIHPINIAKGDQFGPEFLKISPNNRIPAIVDQSPADGSEPIAIFESGAILQYLAEQTGKFLPTEIRHRMDVMQWLFWQVGGLGPMLGQNHHFVQYAPEKIPYAISRYVPTLFLDMLRRQSAFMESWINVLRIASLLQESIPLPIWQPIPG
jgi:GSH-dependent disulfide-bond oxidoreductase